MEKLSNVTGCSTMKPLKGRIVLSVSYLLIVKHILSMDLMTRSILIGCMYMKTAIHTECCLSAASFKTKNARVNHSFLMQIDKEEVYRRAVLKRVVAVVKFLCERGLSLREGNKAFGSPQNGNFEGLLELLEQFDDFLADHIRRFGNFVRGMLSSTICNEFVQLVAKEVTTKIANEITKAKYYSITVEFTPDVTHVDQLILMIMYVQDDGTIVDRFLKFIDSNGQHDVESITNHILRTLTEYDINLNNCRGQSYDNASNLSGKYIGVQARLKALNFFFCICSFLSSIHKKANCIAIFWTGRPHSLGSCLFRDVWATCLPHKGRGVPLSALPKDTTSELAGLFSTTSHKCRAPSREAADTIF